VLTAGCVSLNSRATGGHVALLGEARDRPRGGAVQDRREQRQHVGRRADAAARDELVARRLELALDALRAQAPAARRH
jgi:hypothetical protein